MLKSLDQTEKTDLENSIEGSLEEMHFSFVKSVLGLTQVESENESASANTQGQGKGR